MSFFYGRRYLISYRGFRRIFFLSRGDMSFVRVFFIGSRKFL